MELQFAFFDETDQLFSKDPDRTDTDDFVLTNNQIRSFYREGNGPTTIIIKTLADDPDEFLERGSYKAGIYPSVYIYSDAYITEKTQKLIIFPVGIKNKGGTIFKK